MFLIMQNPMPNAGSAHDHAERLSQTDQETVTAQSPGLGATRLAQLHQDLALTPEARVRAAEESLRLTEILVGRREPVVRGFDRYEDFLDFKRQRDLER